MKKSVVLCILLGGIFSSNASANDQVIQFGIANTKSSTSACVTFKGEALKPGQSVYAIVFNPQRWATGQVIRSRTTPCRRESFLDGAAYDIQLERAASIGFELGFAVVAPKAKLKIENNEVILSSILNKKLTKFRRCVSGEGVHLWTLQDSKLLWHEYYYLGYDAVPTCSEEDYRKMKPAE